MNPETGGCGFCPPKIHRFCVMIQKELLVLQVNEINLAGDGVSGEWSIIHPFRCFECFDQSTTRLSWVMLFQGVLHLQVPEPRS